MTDQPLLFDPEPEDTPKRDPAEAAARDSDPAEAARQAETALLNRMLAALAVEWDIAASGLPPVLREAFRPPGFGLLDGRRQLGAWQRHPIPEIRLSRRLLVDHPWYAVVDVLRHEMAHQLADEALRRPAEEGPHGTTFRRACGYLNADPAARAETTPLDEALREAGRTLRSQDRMLARIRKLLALAESPNVHEAERAMTKAHELMARHNIDVLEHDRQREYTSIRLGRTRARRKLEEKILAALLRDFYFVSPIWVLGADPERWQGQGRVLEISGTRQNVLLAEYVYHFVLEFVEAEWDRTLEEHPRMPRTKRARRDFTIGVVEGFRAKLRQDHSTADYSEALVRLRDVRLTDYLNDRYPRIRKHSGGRVKINQDALEKGREAGGRLVIRKGIDRHAQRKGRRLGSGRQQRTR